MTNLDKLQGWLANPRRKYDEGVALFDALATKSQQAKYKDYVHSASGNVGQFDPRFTMLVNELVRVERGIALEPDLYPAAMTEIVEVHDVAAELREKKAEELTAHQGSLEALRNELVALMEDQSDENNDRAAELSAQIDEHEDAISQLQKDVYELSKPGIKVVREDMMPKKIRAKYERIKEIVPLYASLHNDLSSDSLSDEERQELADKLCDLDDERRKLWQAIDDWSEGRYCDLEQERPQYSKNAVIRGYEFARAIKRLKANISNCEKSAEKAKADGKTTVYDNAMARIARYKQELEGIEHEMNSKDEATE